MKIIFLDIDGVLSSVESMTRKYYRLKEMSLLGKQETKRDCVDWPDDILVSRVKSLIYITGAKLVISSSWRFNSLRKTIPIVEEIGFDKNDIIGQTKRLRKARGYEIQAWLDETEHEIESFVIIDDDSDMEHLSKYLVKVNRQTGIQDDDIDKCIKILNNGV